VTGQIDGLIVKFKENLSLIDCSEHSNCQLHLTAYLFVYYLALR